MQETEKSSTNALHVALISAAFALAYGQAPLYSDNQHTYFLHGLIRAGYGDLHRDWMATTTDPFPLFSLVVQGTEQFLHAGLFHVYYALILAVYFAAIAYILALSCPALDRDEQLGTWLLIVGLHSSYLESVGVQSLGINFRSLFTEGLAHQYLLGDVFQPSVFGVFLVVSVALFLGRRPLLAVVFAVLAAAFHSTYLISSAILVLAYMVILFREDKHFRQVLMPGVLALVLVAPVVVYNYVHFRPTDPQIHSMAAAILVDFRIPHHADPSQWFSTFSVLQIGVVLIAIWLYRRARLMPILAIGAAVTALLSMVQAVSGSDTLALLFPWRPSVWLVPVSTCLIAARLVCAAGAFARSRWSRPPPAHRLRIAAGVLIGLMAAFGLGRSILASVDPGPPERAALMDHVRTHHGEDDLYLISVQGQIASFRLETGLPVVADFHTHPYRDEEVLEWYDRLSKIEAFYQASNASQRCQQLDTLVRNRRVTHVIARFEERFAPCPSTDIVFENEEFSVYAVEHRQ